MAGVYTGCEFRKSGRKYYVYNDVRTGNFLKETLACTFMLSTGSNIFVRKSVVDKLNGFDENFIRHQDYEFLVRLFKNYKIAAIPEILVIKNNENVNLPDPDKMLQIKKQYLYKYQNIIRLLPIKDQNFIFYKNCIEIAEQYMSVCSIRDGIKYYCKSLDYKILSLQDFLRCIGFVFVGLKKWKSNI